MHLCNPYRVPTLFPRGILIFQGLLAKLHFLTKFPVLEKFIDLMDLKYEHQSIYPLWGRVKLNFRDKWGKPIFSKKLLPLSSFFQKIVKK